MSSDTTITPAVLRCPVCDGGEFQARTPGGLPTCVSGCDHSARSVLAGLGDGWVFYPANAKLPPLRKRKGVRRG